MTFAVTALAIAAVATNAMNPISRRSFLATSSAAGIAGTLGAPFQRTGKPNLRLSLAAYSFRSFFKYQKNSMREVNAQPMDLFKFIDCLRGSFLFDLDLILFTFKLYFFAKE